MTNHRESRSESADATRQRVRAQHVASMSVSLAVVLFTTIVVARAVGGHLDRGLRAPPVIGVYLALTLIAGGAAWYRCRIAGRDSSDAFHRWPIGATAVAIVCPLLTAMVLGRNLSVGMLAFLWSMTGLLTGLSLWLLYRRSDAAPLVLREVPSKPDRPAVDKTPPKPATSETHLPSAQSSAAAQIDEPPVVAEQESFSQRWVRREGEIGDELEGTLRIYFAAGQRTATADIPIVPAMARVPDVDCEPLQPSDSDVQVIVRGVHTYGVRLELQRPAERTATEEIEVAVLIHAERGVEN
jgi:hypothetical protein